MSTGYVVLALVTVAACGFSGVAALVRFAPILPGMAAAGVPESWLAFPIGTLKTAGAAGVLAGVLWFPPLATVAAFGLVLFFACAVYTHIRAGDHSAQFALAIGFLLLCGTTMALGVSLGTG